MRIPQISNERVNGFRLESQALSPRVENALDALTAMGTVPAREAAYLATETRVAEFSREDLDQLVFGTRQFTELLAMRGETWLLPNVLLPQAMRCPAPVHREAAIRALADAGIAMAGRPSRSTS